ncbi:MAG: hypothetical protein RR533_05680 [Carnobacterium sp.]
MKKNIVWLVSLIAILILGIFGGMYMNTEEEHKEQDLISIERQSIGALKNTFTDISEVEIEKSVYDEKTGTYGIYVVMTNNQNNSLRFMYNFEKKGDVVYGFVIKDKNIQKRGNTKDKINVTFSNGMEEII